jgi:hypothetical protein
MYLTSTMESIAAQGAMFWAATGSVALGGTLILVALVAQLNRLRNRRSRLAGTAEVASRTIGKKPSAEEESKVESVEREILSPSSSPTAEMADIRELRGLASRLRAAADKLEDHRRQNGHEPALPAESPLKETVDPVDYVFRAGLG